MLFLACPYNNLPIITSEDTPNSISNKWSVIHCPDSPKKGRLVDFEQKFFLQSGGWKWQVIQYLMKLIKYDQIIELLNRLQRKIVNADYSMAFPPITLYYWKKNAKRS